MNYYIIEKKYYDDDWNEHYFVYDERLFKTSKQARDFIAERQLEDYIITELTLMEDK